MRRSSLLFAALLFVGCTSAGTEEPDAGVPAPDASGGSADRATMRGLHYSADLRVMESFPVQLDARLQVHNPLDRAARLEVPGGCPLHILAFRDSARTQLAWDQGHAIACTLQIEMIELPPNGQHEFSARASAADVLGDSLPDGTYHMSARLAANDTTIMQPIGSAPLAVPR